MRAQADATQQQVKMQAKIKLTRIRTELDARMKILDSHQKAVAEQQKMHHAQAHHEMEVAEAALGLMASAPCRDAKRQARSGKDESNH